MLPALIVIGAFLFVSMLSSIRVLREYERAIVFRLGRAKHKALGPGPVLLLPWGIDRATVVDTRTKVIQIPQQEVITRDNISIGVDAVVYADVGSPMDAILRVEQYMPATLQLAATTLRSIIGRMELDEVLAKRQEINDEVRTILDQRTEQWGVEITAVEIKDISLPVEMKRAMARQAEAERERRAKVIMSEGELQAAEKLAQAARLIGSEPAALQLRLYQTLVEVSGEANSTIVMPVPIELLTGGQSTGNAGQIVANATAALAANQAKQLEPGQSAGRDRSAQARARGRQEVAVRVLPRFLYRAPLLPVGGKLEGALAEQALALGRVVPEARQNYARRAAFRATPHGLWAGVGMGALGDATRAATGAMRAEIMVAYERLWQLGRERLDPALARLRVAPSLVRDDTTALWLAFDRDGETVQRAADVDEVLAAVLDGAREWIAWRALADAVEVDDDFLLLLVDDGVLVHDGVPPLIGPRPRAPLPGEPAHAVLVHEGEVTLSRAVVERAAALAPLLFALQEALLPPISERVLNDALVATEEIFGAGAYDLGALALGRFGTPLDADEEAPPPAQHAGVVRAIVGAIIEAVAARAEAAPLDRAALEAIAPDVALPATFELMLAPTPRSKIGSSACTRRRARAGDASSTPSARRSSRRCGRSSTCRRRSMSISRRRCGWPI